jgi:hypothetical protein
MIIIILFEVPVSMILCSFGCVCTSTFTSALRLSSCLCGAEASGIFGFFSVLIPKSLLSLESHTIFILAVKSFECGIDDVSVGNLTRGELATA